MKRILPFLLVLAMLSVLLMPVGVFADDKAELLTGSQVRAKFDNSKNSVKEVYKASNGKSLPYRLYVPDGYDSSKKYPLVLFFHGAGERGTDNNAQISAGSVMQRLLTDAESSRFPCLILAPQCPGDSQWVLSDWGPGVYNHNTMQTPISPYMAAAEELLAKVTEEYSVDQSRLYVTGMSMGGFGTWDIISRNPDMFAAAFPVCGGVDETYLEALKGFPIWTFHNDGDGIVSSAGTKKAYEILKDAGGITYTEFKSTAHDAWTAAYSTPALMSWVFTKFATLEVTYPTVENLTISGPNELVRGNPLTIQYSASAGFGLESLTVDGVEVEFTDAKSGKVTIAEYCGGEIKASVIPMEEDDTEKPGGNVTSGETEKPDTTKDEGGNTLMIVIIAVVAVVAIIAVAGVLVISKKKKQ